MPEVCSRDVATLVVDLCRSNTDETKKVMMSSAYFPHEEGGSLQPRPVVKLMEYYQAKRLPLIVGCNANAHHTIWNTSNINDRSRRLLEYLVATDLEILNRGNEPTFQTVLRHEVLDLILCSWNLDSQVAGLI
ncbi:hypothetical protein ACFW04_010058 [Cataglyphis niger]